MTNTTTLRELAHRAHDGLEVTLLWDEDSNEVSIDVVDERNDSSFSLPILRLSARCVPASVRVRPGLGRSRPCSIVARPVAER